MRSFQPIGLQEQVGKPRTPRASKPCHVCGKQTGFHTVYIMTGGRDGLKRLPTCADCYAEYDRPRYV